MSGELHTELQGECSADEQGVTRLRLRLACSGMTPGDLLRFELIRGKHISVVEQSFTHNFFVPYDLILFAEEFSRCTDGELQRTWADLGLWTWVALRSRRKSKQQVRLAIFTDEMPRVDTIVQTAEFRRFLDEMKAAAEAYEAEHEKEDPE